jgi:hypothetical protein
VPVRQDGAPRSGAALRAQQKHCIEFFVSLVILWLSWLRPERLRCVLCVFAVQNSCPENKKIRICYTKFHRHDREIALAGVLKRPESFGNGLIEALVAAEGRAVFFVLWRLIGCGR